MTTVPAAVQVGVSRVSALKVELGGEQLNESSRAPPPAGANSVVIVQLVPVRAGMVRGFRKLTVAVPVPLDAPLGPVVTPLSIVNRRVLPTAALAVNEKLLGDDSTTEHETDAPPSPSTIRGS